jgi:tripeptidyl-peptidase-1
MRGSLIMVALATALGVGAGAHRRSPKQVSKPSPSKELTLLIGFALEFDDSKLLLVSTPGSSSFRQFESFDAVRSAATKDAAECGKLLRAWLPAGMRAAPYSAYGEYWTVRGTAEQLEALLAVSFGVYQDPSSGRQAVGLTPESDPVGTMPRDLGQCISFFSTVEDLPAQRPASGSKTSPMTPQRKPKSGPTAYACSTEQVPQGVGADQVVLPSVLERMYSVPAAAAPSARRSPLRKAFYMDSGSAVQTRDQKCFARSFGNNATALTQVYGVSAQVVAGELADEVAFDVAGESNLDAQYMSAMDPHGPLATVFTSFGAVAEPTAALDAPFSTAVIFLATRDGVPDVVSWSYGANEIGPAGFESANARRNAWHVCREFGLMGLRGMTHVVASGDGGATGNRAGGCQEGYNPQFQGGCPYLTVVGATTGYAAGSEVVASGESGSGIVSGGGFSSLWNRTNVDLSWQSDAVDEYLASIDTLQDGAPMVGFNRAGRAFPDISLAGTNYCVSLSGQFNCGVSGTSASTPVLAGLVARIGSEAGQRFGWLNPVIYKNRAQFFDVVSGQNSGSSGSAQRAASNVCPGPKAGTIWGFPALKGWDASTGVGTLGTKNGYSIFRAMLLAASA